MLNLGGHIFGFLWPFKRKYAKQTKYFWCYFFSVKFVKTAYEWNQKSTY